MEMETPLPSRKEAPLPVALCPHCRQPLHCICCSQPVARDVPSVESELIARGRGYSRG